MLNTNDKQAIALIGLLQAAHLVDQLARQGSCSTTSMESSIATLFVPNAELYDNPSALPTSFYDGINLVKQMVKKQENALTQTTIRYALGMLTLQKQLSQKNDDIQTIAERLNTLAEKADFFSPDTRDYQRFLHPSILSGIDAVYQETISKFSFRIQIQGNPQHLQSTENAARIRALLLAGIHAASLWRSAGGKRWHFLFFRSRMKEALAALKL